MGQRTGALEAVAVTQAFWRGRRVFLTGHTGFKGGWLALWLQELGASVTGFALAPPPGPSLFETARVTEGMQSTIGDIRDAPTLAAAMEKAQPEIVFHLAAQSLVGIGYTDPVTTYATNVLGTVNLLEAVRATPSVRAVVNVTSDKCYENREWPWGYRENEALGGRDPYSSSKACAELVTVAYRESFLRTVEVALASARAGNVIGGGDWARDRLVPDLLSAFASGRPARLRRPAAVRPWQHVLEPLHGYLALARKLVEEGQSWAEAWNFGPHQQDVQTVQCVAEGLAARWGAEAQVIHSESDFPHEAQQLRLDIGKAGHRLGWTPRWRLDEALGATVAWHRAWLSGEDMRAVSLTQIERYTRAESAP